LWGWYRDQQIFLKLQTQGEKALTAEDWMKLPDILAAEYKKDTYGSTTPEGTLSLFIDALKKGDADLASKYFIPEKQPEYKKAVENWTRLGKNMEIADTLARAEDGTENMEGSYMMTVFENNVAQNSISFLKNNYSGKWKLQNM